jgi:polyisoprenoid-binding protein YceI
MKGATMRPFVNLILHAVVLGLAACSAPHRAPQSAASASSSASPATAATAGGIRLTPQNTKIEFVGSSERTSQSGNFQQFTGTFDLTGNDLRMAHLTLDIDMDSITTNISLLTRHLKGDDFFDVSRYPRSIFVSTAIQPSTMPGATHLITGNLTLHGVTRTISAPANLGLAGGLLTLNSRFLIRQSEFGMMEALKKSKDEVPITVSIRASRS